MLLIIMLAQQMIALTKLQSIKIARKGYIIVSDSPFEYRVVPMLLTISKRSIQSYAIQ